ncbi:hypothetical protein GCM10011369_27180 [Neiella marina]|uniref:DUF1508 domain-containing protein n=1 Tax=Neiella marina TaxID=508461 RepID=A0A8J2U776_9GAMM|nr:hypothetical protein [Neiella marina]GGA83737.1 hypothetical protein GCM10011369_27180 [Neiella marina]
MTKPRIDPQQLSDTPLDASHLFNQSIEHIIALSGEVWTDYNKHDPGVTLLEVLCYLLTEVSYRLQADISDVLVDDIPDDNNEAKNHRLLSHFPAADEVLTCAPLTELDYRKYLIDIPGVENAWIAPAPNYLYLNTDNNRITVKAQQGSDVRALTIKGGYQVTLELTEGLNAQAKKQVIEQVEQALNRQRNLCEWFAPLKLVGKQNFIICGDIEISPHADANDVYVAIMLAVHNYVQPPIDIRSDQQQLQQQDWADALFNGPRLSHGFVDSQSVAETRLGRTLYLSDLITLIMQLDDVVAVHDLVINPDGQKQPLADRWQVAVTDNKKAQFKAQASHLTLLRRGLPAHYDKERALADYKSQLKSGRQRREQVMALQLQSPVGNSTGLRSYHSVSRDLPAVYGLSDAGLSNQASELRKAQALQLSGYLTLFDQLAISILAQASHLNDLLSPETAQERSYFSFVAKSVANWQLLLGDDPTATAKLDSVLTNETVDLDRRNRLMDFMVARFGEDLTDLTTAMLNAFGLAPRATLRYKSQLYQTITWSSRDRGLGHDISQRNQYWNTNNVSGLELRLCRLLGIANSNRRNLGDVAYDIYAELDTTPDDEYRFRIRNRDSGAILLSSSTRYDSKAAAKAEMRQTILFGSLPSHYQIATSKDGRFYFNIIDDQGEVIARRIEYFTSEQLARAAIEEVVDYLTVNYSDEGMYLIEHSWLIPKRDDEPQLAIATDDHAIESNEPYSYQIHIILPAYGARFASMEFRRYCETVIRSEVPAHIMPRVCWVDKDDMAQIEKAYHDWLAILHGATTTDADDRKQALIDAICALNNVYPQQPLHTCESEDTGFVLGRTALGTFKESL